MLDLENGHFIEACAVRCMSKHFRRSGEREALCTGAGVCSLLFATLVPILSLPHAPSLSHFAVIVSFETERNVKKEKIQ